MTKYRTIYLDSASAYPISQQVKDAVSPYIFEKFEDPNSNYTSSYEVKKAIELARKQIADSLFADPSQLIFTSSGTEANNWVIASLAFALRGKGLGNHIITSQIEHESVLNTCRYLQRNGFNITYLPVTSEGIIRISDFEHAITDKTIFASIMMVNHDIGSIQPIQRIGQICRSRCIQFHTDASQALGKISVDVNSLNVNYLTASSRKLGGLAGNGIIYSKVDDYDCLTTLLYGESQEKGLHAGAYNVPGIVAFGEASEIANKNIVNNYTRIKYLRDYLLSKLLTIEGAHINGPDIEDRCYNNINIRFDDVDGAFLQNMLAKNKICVCDYSLKHNLHSNHVLKAIGLSEKECDESIRLSISDINIIDECDLVAETISYYVDLARNSA